MINNKISKKGTFGTTMGVTSIIAILVILVLIVFAALSITTAKADLKLSEKTAESVAAFYKADTKAEEMLAEVAAAMEEAKDMFADVAADVDENVYPSVNGQLSTHPIWSLIISTLGDDYKITNDKENDALIEYEVPISDGEALSVKLRVKLDGKITRELWRVHSTTEWEGDNDLQLIIE